MFDTEIIGSLAGVRMGLSKGPPSISSSGTSVAGELVVVRSVKWRFEGSLILRFVGLSKDRSLRSLDFIGPDEYVMHNRLCKTC